MTNQTTGASHFEAPIQTSATKRHRMNCIRSMRGGFPVSVPPRVTARAAILPCWMHGIARCIGAPLTSHDGARTGIWKPSQTDAARLLCVAASPHGAAFDASNRAGQDSRQGINSRLKPDQRRKKRSFCGTVGESLRMHRHCHAKDRRPQSPLQTMHGKKREAGRAKACRRPFYHQGVESIRKLPGRRSMYSLPSGSHLTDFFLP